MLKLDSSVICNQILLAVLILSNYANLICLANVSLQFFNIFVFHKQYDLNIFCYFLISVIFICIYFFLFFKIRVFHPVAALDSLSLS
jgi:hypothetical protein